MSLPEMTHGERILWVAFVLAAAYYVHDNTQHAFALRTDVHRSTSFSLDLYLECHAWRQDSWLGNLIVDRDSMPAIPYDTVDAHDVRTLIASV